MIDQFSVALLTEMADCQSHDVASLASAVGLDLPGVSLRLHSLLNEGVNLEFQGDRCRLLETVECLSESTIQEHLQPTSAAHLANIQVFPCIDSTNRYLLEKLESGQREPMACLAECQQAGRGRRGRAWSSPFAANLYLSLLWRFSPAPTDLPALSLASGVAVVHALESLGLSGVRLKWPNDLLWEGRKLAGILLESRFIGRTAIVVIGIGINVAMPAERGESIDQPWVDLREINAGVSPSRNALAAAVLDKLVATVTVFQHQGFAPLAADWRRLDGFYGQQVILHLPDGRQVSGVARGIDESGALCLDNGQAEQYFPVGEVSLRGQ